jgi:hypothetical protein
MPRTCTGRWRYPNGNLVTSNGDAVNSDPNQPSELVEFTPAGQFVGEFSVDSAASGSAFGIAVQAIGDDVRLAAVDDNLNTLDVWTTDVGGQVFARGDSSAGDTQYAARLGSESSQAFPVRAENT